MAFFSFGVQYDFQYQSAADNFDLYFTSSILGYFECDMILWTKM